MVKRARQQDARVRRIMLIDLMIGLAVFAVFAAGLVYIMQLRSFQFYGHLYDRVETKQKLVALTFDDGPLPNKTGQILQKLAENDVKASFFLIGNEIIRHPNEARQIAAAGHEIGNHTYSHRALVFTSRQFIQKEVTETDQLIRAIGYNGPITFRPPYGYKLLGLPKYLRDTKRATVSRDVAPDEDKDSQSITNEVVRKVRPGSIILLHAMYDHRQASLDSIEPIITRLETEGYKFVTVSQLLQAQR